MSGSGPRLVDRQVVIRATPGRVYALLTEAAGLVRWLAPEAEADPRPGGTITWRHANGDRVSGRFVELVPDRRIVFTYGWDRPDVGIPPGSTTVEITLTPILTPDGTATELRLVHRGLSGPMTEAHGGGWAHYLRRLARAGEGDEPGDDRLAGERVPTAASLAGQAFAELAEAWLARPGVTRSTMMGLPCLRRDGTFFAAHDVRTGDLLVKLTEERVTALVTAGQAHPFAPAGRRFRRWAAVPPEGCGAWSRLTGEAFAGAEP